MFYGFGGMCYTWVLALCRHEFVICLLVSLAFRWTYYVGYLNVLVPCCVLLMNVGFGF